MASRVVIDDAPVASDPACVPDIFCEGLTGVAKLAGDCVRLTIFATRDLGAGESERIVVGQLVWSAPALHLAMQQIDAVLEGLPFLSTAVPLVVPS